MKVTIPKGKYVVAVSGGVDSMVLLDLLAKQVTGYRLQVTCENRPDSTPTSLHPSNPVLIVAHFNHGIRSDSAEDEKLVEKTALKYGLPCEVGYGKLGKAASEAKAREARYQFLEEVKHKHLATAIVTAHHQDDLIETALINLLRGTHWRGLSSVKNKDNLLRPFLNTSKAQILEYAEQKHLKWREDTSNEDEKYLRNYLRLNVIPAMPAKTKQDLLSNIDKVAENRSEIDKIIATISHQLLKNNEINRKAFNSLPDSLANEVLVDILKQQAVDDLDTPTIQRLSLAIRNAPSGSTHDVKGDLKLKVTTNVAVFSRGH